MQNRSSDDVSSLLDVLDLRTTVPPELDILKCIEGLRVMPAGSPFEGIFTNSLTPYWGEIYENLSPASPVQHTVIRKPAQVGATTIAENIIAYFMKFVPAEILYISGTQDLLTLFSVRKLDPLLISCDLIKLLAPLNESIKSRRSGSTTLLKEYPGGSLALASAQSPSQMRFTSRRILIRDEVDSAPHDLKNDEGNWLSVSFKRTIAYGQRRKVLDLSTPVGYDQSNIQKLYEAGDQRHYQIPCLKCGEFQEITFNALVPIYDENQRLTEIYYPCKTCGHRHYNHDKTRFLKLGKWIPTAVSKSDSYRSYYISGLYSPPGMMSWEDMRLEFDEAQLDESKEKMKAFVTLSLGKPYRDVTTKPRLQRVVGLRGDYRQKAVPAGVLYLVAAIDVQTGTKDPRLEMEVLGIGDQWRTWSADYRVVRGEVTDPTGGAWAALYQGVVNEHWFNYRRKDGMVFEPKMIFIDTGDGNISEIVYSFISGYGWKNTFAIKGFGTVRTTTNKMIRYRPHSSGSFIEINTNHYKKIIYGNLSRSYTRFDATADIQDIGFCHFPAEYPESYFEMLTAEDARSDGTFFCPHGRRNEALDCRVYALCASDFFLDQCVKKLQATLRERQVPESEVLKCEHKFVLRKFAADTKQEYPYRPQDLAEYIASKKTIA